MVDWLSDIWENLTVFVLAMDHHNPQQDIRQY